MAKTYFIRRQNEKVTLDVMEDGVQRSIPHIGYHSPTGFEYGYGGSGPAELALCIMLDYFGENVPKKSLGVTQASKHYQDFKWEFIANQEKRNLFIITEGDIDEWMNGR